MTRRSALISTLVWVLAASAATCFAQEDYPSRPITMLVPFPPGGVADAVGRPVAEAMGRYLKQSVIVENKGGAGGGIGMAQVAKSKPDGYTMLMALSSSIIVQGMTVPTRSRSRLRKNHAPTVVGLTNITLSVKLLSIRRYHHGKVKEESA